MQREEGVDAPPQLTFIGDVPYVYVPTEGEEEPTNETNQCIWCEEEVEGVGETCDIDCFFLWWAHYNSMAMRGIVILPDGHAPPKLIHEQPWFDSGD